jgi:hypothetical protein
MGKEERDWMRERSIWGDPRPEYARGGGPPGQPPFQRATIEPHHIPPNPRVVRSRRITTYDPRSVWLGVGVGFISAFAMLGAFLWLIEHT